MTASRLRTCTQAAVAAGLILGTALPAAAQIPARAAIGPSAYTPTMQDVLGVQDALATYRWGLENRDTKIKATAFVEGGFDATIVNGQEVGREVRRGDDMVSDRPPPGAPGAGGAPPGGAPPGGAPPGGAPPGGAPPGGAPGAGGAPAGQGMGPPPGGDLWHVAINDNWRWESPTRAVHYGYWLSVYQGTERLSTIGQPGHYEDVLEKVNGKWLIKERKIIVGKK